MRRNAPDGSTTDANPLAAVRAPSMWDGVWIAIPAYNEAASIRALALACLALCPRLLVVDDGSSDGTAQRLRGLPLTLLRHPSNRGKAASLRSAFAHALAQGALCVITLDGDGQHDPLDAPHLLAAWRAQPDRLVIGARLHDRAVFPPARYMANRFACFWISWAAGHPIADSQSGFRVYSNELMRIATGPRVRGGGFTFESEIAIEAARQGHTTLAVAIAGRYPPEARPSHFRPVSDIAAIGKLVTLRLLKTGLYPQGLWRSLCTAQVLPAREDAARSDAGQPRAGARGDLGEPSL